MSNCEHENVIKNQVLGKTFHVCRDCKEEVVEERVGVWVLKSVKPESSPVESVKDELSSKLDDLNLDDFGDWDMLLKTMRTDSNWRVFCKMWAGNEKTVDKYLEMVTNELITTKGLGSGTLTRLENMLDFFNAVADRHGEDRLKWK